MFVQNARDGALPSARSNGDRWGHYINEGGPRNSSVPRNADLQSSYLYQKTKDGINYKLRKPDDPHAHLDDASDEIEAGHPLNRAGGGRKKSFRTYV